VHCSTGSSLTIDNAAALEHGSVIGLWWFIPGMALASAHEEPWTVPMIITKAIF
jgi:hypothetical protein